MKCPKCGTANAEPVFFTVECPNDDCSLYNAKLAAKLAAEVSEEDNKNIAESYHPLFTWGSFYQSDDE